VPVSKTLYYANVLDHKLYKLKLESHSFVKEMFKQSLEILPSKKIENQITIVGSRSHKSKETDDFIKSIEKYRVTRKRN